MSTIRLLVISLQGVFLKEMVDFVKFHGPMGQIGILKDHAPLLTIVSKGAVSYKIQNSEETFHTLGGIFEIQANKAILLADYCSREQIALKTMKMKDKTAQYKAQNEHVRSFHQLYFELARNPVELAALKGLNKLQRDWG